jgi:Tfp pilus assembly protein FimT
MIRLQQPRFSAAHRNGLRHWRGPYGCTEQGLTLLELLLVLGILVLMASLAVPAVLRSVSSQSLDKGAEMVRAEMARARVMAIKTGKVHALVMTSGGSRMLVDDFDSLIANDGIGRLAQSANNDELRSGPTEWGDGLLPKGVIFVQGESMSTSRSEFESAAGSSGSGGSPGGGQIQPILFYPDGTCQDARVILQNTKNETKQVTLRGLTGTTRVSNPTDQ